MEKAAAKSAPARSSSTSERWVIASPFHVEALVNRAPIEVLRRRWTHRNDIPEASDEAAVIQPEHIIGAGGDIAVGGEEIQEEDVAEAPDEEVSPAPPRREATALRLRPPALNGAKCPNVRTVEARKCLDAQTLA